MSQTWLIIEVNYLQVSNVDIIENLIVPVIEKFQSHLTSYHFLHEGHILLRLKGEHETLKEKIKPYIISLVTKLSLSFVKEPFLLPEYNERGGFGEGSDLAIELLGIATRMYLFERKAKKENLALGQKYKPIYFSHLFLNMWDNDFFGESREHFAESMGRMSLGYTFQSQLGQEKSIELNNAVAPQVAPVAVAKFNEISEMTEQKTKDEIVKSGNKVPDKFIKLRLGTQKKP